MPRHDFGEDWETKREEMLARLEAAREARKEQLAERYAAEEIDLERLWKWVDEQCSKPLHYHYERRCTLCGTFLQAPTKLDLEEAHKVHLASKECNREIETVGASKSRGRKTLDR